MLINLALLKYNLENFKLEILEYCPLELTLSREQYYLDLLKPEYNILKIAGSSKGYTHTPESKAKYSSRTISEQTLKKMSCATRKKNKIFFLCCSHTKWCVKEFKVMLQKIRLVYL